MLRTAGLALIVLACTALGAGMGRQLLERVCALKEMERLLSMLKGEIRYAATPLGDAFAQLSGRCGERYRAFLAGLSRALNMRGGKGIAELFQECAEATLQKSGLTRADIEQLLQLGMRLGYLDCEMQVHAIELYQEELAADRAAAEADYREKAKVFRSLGFLGGLFLVILLL